MRMTSTARAIAASGIGSCWVNDFSNEIDMDQCLTAEYSANSPQSITLLALKHGLLQHTSVTPSGIYVIDQRVYYEFGWNIGKSRSGRNGS